MKLSLSLYKKAFLALALLLFPVLTAFFVGYTTSKTHLKDLILSDLTIISEAYEGQIYQFLEMSKMRAIDFASDGFIRGQLQEIVRSQKSGVRSPAAVSALSEHLVRNKKPLDKAIRDIHVISMGRIIASTDSSLIGKELPGESFFMDNKGEAVVTESVSLGAPSLLIFTPVTDRVSREMLGGVLVNAVSLSELNKLLTGELARDLGAVSRDKGRPKTMKASLINRDNLMVTGSSTLNEAALNHLVDTLPVRECLDAGKEMRGFYKDYRGVEVAGSSMCLPSMKWVLLVEVDAEEVLAPLSEMKRSALTASAIVAGIIGFLFAVFLKNIVMRLQTISDASKQISLGNYDIAIPVRTSDEIGGLSEVFNAMASDIKSGTDALRAGTNALRKSEERLANAQRIAHLGNWDWDIIKNELYWSDEIYRIFRLAPQEFGVTYEAFLNSVHPDDRELVKKAVYEALEGERIYSIDHRIVLPDGKERIVHEEAEVSFDETGKPIKMTGTVQDITEHKLADIELNKLSMAMEHSINVIFITDNKGNIEYVNPMFEQVTGWMKEEAIGQNPRILSSGETTKAEYQELWGTVSAGKTWRGVFKNKKKNGEFYWENGVITPIKNERGEITNFLAVQEDITEKKISEERIEYLAYYDDMTGLLNRTRFTELLNEWIRTWSNREGVLLLINIDGFKLINDTYGHGIGDKLLSYVAGLIESAVKGITVSKGSGSEVLAGRTGGDEFALFLPYTGVTEGMETAELIREKVAESRFMEVPVLSTLSIGVVCYPEHGGTIKELFTKVDAALSRAKEMGRNRCHIYRPEDRDLENIHSRMKEKAAIQVALAEDRFVPWLQPILNLKDDKIDHYEALARMRTEDGSMLSPGEFIDTAERFGLIGNIDRIITEKTMRFQADSSRHGKHISFGMNLSGKSLGDEELLSFLKSKIVETGADPSHLIFEITETAAVHDLDRAIKFINALKSMGCRFSLDDFGVGFTSFVYLSEMQVDYIKIDGSFVRKLPESQNDQLFVKAIVDVARGMGIKTIAEFVENEKTLDLLKEFGVDYAQGYYIGKPDPELLSR